MALDLLAFAFAAILLTFYEIYQFVTKYLNDNLEIIFYVRFGGVVILGPVVLVLVFVVYREFGWRDFKTVGSDLTMLRFFREFNRFGCLMEVDFQLSVSLVTFGVAGYLIIAEQPLFTMWETIAYGIFAVLTLLWLVAGYHGAKRENRPVMAIWMLLSTVEPAYIIYFIVEYSINRNGVSNPNDSVVLLMFLIGLLAIIFRLALVAAGIRVLFNFGHGLREKVFERVRYDIINERSPLNVDL